MLRSWRRAWRVVVVVVGGLVATACTAGAEAVLCSEEEAAANVQIFYNALLCESGGGSQRPAGLCESCTTAGVPSRYGEVLSRDCAGGCCIDIINRNPDGTQTAAIDWALNEHVYNSAAPPATGFVHARGAATSACNLVEFGPPPAASCAMTSCSWYESMRAGGEGGAAAEAVFPWPKRAEAPPPCQDLEALEKADEACVVDDGAQVFPFAEPGAATAEAAAATPREAATEKVEAGEEEAAEEAAEDAVEEDVEPRNEKGKSDSEGQDAENSEADGSGGLSLPASLGISAAGIAAVAALACLCMCCVRRRLAARSNKEEQSEHKPFPDAEAQKPSVPRATPVAGTGYGPSPSGGGGGGGAATTGAGGGGAGAPVAVASTGYTHDTYGFPVTLSVYRSRLPERLSDAADINAREPADPRAPMHVALAVDTSRGGATSRQARAMWSDSLGCLLDALDEALEGRLRLSLVSFAGDDAYQVKVTAPPHGSVVDAYREALRNVQPPLGEGMRSKARATAHVRAVDVCREALVGANALETGTSRKRVLLVTASGVSDGETQVARSSAIGVPKQSSWTAPQGVVVVGVTRDHRPEALVQLGKTAVTCDGVHVCGTVAGIDSLVQLLMQRID